MNELIYQPGPKYYQHVAADKFPLWCLRGRDECVSEYAQSATVIGRRFTSFASEMLLGGHLDPERTEGTSADDFQH